MSNDGTHDPLLNIDATALQADAWGDEAERLAADGDSADALAALEHALRANVAVLEQLMMLPEWRPTPEKLRAYRVLADLLAEIDTIDNDERED
jgi:type III secretion system FlhB-like substrate exporter